MLHPAALLAVEESRAAEKATLDEGVSVETLMESAGRAVVDVIVQEYDPCHVLVICGVGHNGGDGFVVARLLRERGWEVTLGLVGEANDLIDEVGNAKDKWSMVGGATRTLTSALLTDCELIVDALLGTGLSRIVEGLQKDAIVAMNNSGVPIVSIDIASGINANNGAIMGVAVKATNTVSFVRPKPGHILLPGKAHTGELSIYDIGVVGEEIKPLYFINAPTLWKHLFPFPAASAHKYDRGHAIIVGGGMSSTGAARLAAMSSLRSGAGLVSVASPPDALPIYAMTLTSIMTKPFAVLADLQKLLEDKHITATLIGPGCGVSENTREQVLHILSHKKACVIDADAISVFKKNDKALFAAIAGPTVLTPHEGEFERIFTVKGSRPERAKEAAKQSGAVIVLKGNDTIIAAPDGRITINANAPVWLATAGTGDVLAGIITGLLAQGMPAFEAACAGVWLHSEAANHFGPGLIAEDLPASLPSALKILYQV